MRTRRGTRKLKPEFSRQWVQLGARGWEVVGASASPQGPIACRREQMGVCGIFDQDWGCAKAHFSIKTAFHDARSRRNAIAGSRSGLGPDARTTGWSRRMRATLSVIIHRGWTDAPSLSDHHFSLRPSLLFPTITSRSSIIVRHCLPALPHTLPCPTDFRACSSPAQLDSPPLILYGPQLSLLPPMYHWETPWMIAGEV